MIGRCLGALGGFLLGTHVVGAVTLLAMGARVDLPGSAVGAALALFGAKVGGWVTNGVY